MDNLNSCTERISDYGCRKLLHLKYPVSSYLNGVRQSNSDRFCSSKGIIKSSYHRKLLLAGGAVGALVTSIAYILKNKKMPTVSSEKVKIGLSDKIKNFFKSKKSSVSFESVKSKAKDCLAKAKGLFKK